VEICDHKHHKKFLVQARSYKGFQDVVGFRTAINGYFQGANGTLILAQDGWEEAYSIL